MEAVAYDERPVMEAAVLFAQTEGIISAPESAYAIKSAIDEALKTRKEGKKKIILFNLSGHGFLDLQAYADFFQKKLISDKKRLKSY
jgi:tryptophan synthase beta chain